MAAARQPRDAERAEALYRRAAKHHQAGHAARAERDYRRTLKHFPGHVGAICQLAMIEGQSGRLRQGIERLERAAQASPTPEIFNNLGVLLRFGGRVEEAIDAYRRALELDPAHLNACFNLGNSLQAVGRAEEAAETYREVIRRTPGNARGWAGLGSALLDAGRPREALPALEHSLALAPRASFTLNELGLVHTDLGDFENAAEYFRRALDIEPDHTKACLNLVRTRRIESVDDPDVARIEAALPGAAGDPESGADLHFALGKVYDDGARYEQALAHFTEANRLAGRGAHFDGARRGREIDAIAAAFDRALFERLGHVGSDSELPVFIVGMPRSGTSLVEQIIASHPQAAGAGELPDIAEIARSLAAEIGSADPYPRCVESIDRHSATRLAERYLGHLRSMADREVLRITDKMPSNWPALGLIALLLPRARVIHCRRDPRDTAVSIYFRRFTRGHPYSFRFADIAAEQRAYQRLMAHWREVLPLPMIEVDYETLVRAPEPEIRRLVEFTGLEWDPRCLRFHETERAVHTASAWQVRQPIYDRSAGRWRNYAPYLGDLGREWEEQGAP